MVDRWKKQGTQPLHDYGFLRLRRDSYVHPNLDGERNFLVIDSHDWVNVIAVTPDQQIVLIRQFRYGVGEILWEIPAGVIESGETPAEAAVRELREETGFAGESAEFLCSYDPNPAIHSNHCTSYVVRGAELVHDLDWDDNEIIEVVLKPIAEVEAMILRGEFSHALLQLPLLRYFMTLRS